MNLPGPAKGDTRLFSRAQTGATSGGGATGA